MKPPVVLIQTVNECVDWVIHREKREKVLDMMDMNLEPQSIKATGDDNDSSSAQEEAGSSSNESEEDGSSSTSTDEFEDEYAQNLSAAEAILAEDAGVIVADLASELAVIDAAPSEDDESSSEGENEDVPISKDDDVEESISEEEDGFRSAVEDEEKVRAEDEVPATGEQMHVQGEKMQLHTEGGEIHVQEEKENSPEDGEVIIINDSLDDDEGENMQVHGEGEKMQVYGEGEKMPVQADEDEKQSRAEDIEVIVMNDSSDEGEKMEVHIEGQKMQIYLESEKMQIQADEEDKQSRPDDNEVIVMNDSSDDEGAKMEVHIEGREKMQVHVETTKMPAQADEDEKQVRPEDNEVFVVSDSPDKDGAENMQMHPPEGEKMQVHHDSSDDDAEDEKMLVRGEGEEMHVQEENEEQARPDDNEEVIIIKDSCSDDVRTRIFDDNDEGIESDKIPIHDEEIQAGEDEVQVRAEDNGFIFDSDSSDDDEGKMEAHAEEEQPRQDNGAVIGRVVVSDSSDDDADENMLVHVEDEQDMHSRAEGDDVVVISSEDSSEGLSDDSSEDGSSDSSEDEEKVKSPLNPRRQTPNPRRQTLGRTEYEEVLEVRAGDNDVVAICSDSPKGISESSEGDEDEREQVCLKKMQLRTGGNRTGDADVIDSDSSDEEESEELKVGGEDSDVVICRDSSDDRDARSDSSDEPKAVSSDEQEAVSSDEQDADSSDAQDADFPSDEQDADSSDAQDVDSSSDEQDAGSSDAQGAEASSDEQGADSSDAQDADASSDEQESLHPPADLTAEDEQAVLEALLAQTQPPAELLSKDFTTDDEDNLDELQEVLDEVLLAPDAPPVVDFEDDDFDQDLPPEADDLGRSAVGPDSLVSDLGSDLDGGALARDKRVKSSNTRGTTYGGTDCPAPYVCGPHIQPAYVWRGTIRSCNHGLHT